MDTLLFFHSLSQSLPLPLPLPLSLSLSYLCSGLLLLLRGHHLFLFSDNNNNKMNSSIMVMIICNLADMPHSGYKQMCGKAICVQYLFSFYIFSSCYVSSFFSFSVSTIDDRLATIYNSRARGSANVLLLLFLLLILHFKTNDNGTLEGDTFE